MQEEALRRWLARHTPAERMRAGLDLSDAATEQVVAQVLREHPEATLADIRAHIRKRKEA